MKYLNKILNLGIIAFMLVSLNSCELDEGSLGITSPQANYATESGVENGLIGINALYKRNLEDYCLIKEKLVAFTGADDLTATALKPQFGASDRFAQDGGSQQLNQIWTLHYRCIAQCNDFLYHIDPANFDAEFYNHAVGNARFFRGIQYLELVNLFGSVPLMTEPTYDDKINSSSVEKILKTVVIPDLEFAAQHVINSERDTDGGVSSHSINSMASKTAAKAFLAKAYMTLAGWPVKEDTQENWTKVKENTKAIIDEGIYTLLDDYAHNFGWVGLPTIGNQPWEGNAEAIWSRIGNAENSAYYRNQIRFNGSAWIDWEDLFMEAHFYEKLPGDYRSNLFSF